MRVPGRAALPPLVVAIAAACAAPRDASTVAKPDRPPPPVSGVSTSTSGLTAAGSGAPATTPGGTPADVDASLVKEGYRVVRRHDQVLYCRTQSVTGSLFASSVCLTASQIANQKRDLQQSKDLLNRAGGVQCVGPECVGK